MMGLLQWRRDDLHTDEPERAQGLMRFVYGVYDPDLFYREGCLTSRTQGAGGGLHGDDGAVRRGGDAAADILLGFLIVSFAAQIASRPCAAPVATTFWSAPRLTSSCSTSGSVCSSMTNR